MARCSRCGREFANNHALGQHLRQARGAAAKGRKNRICPDNSTTEQAHDEGSVRARMLAELRGWGRRA